MNFSLRKIEERQKRINDLSSRKSYRRNEIFKYLRGLFIVFFIILVSGHMIFLFDHMVTNLHRVEKKDLLAKGKQSSMYDSNGELIQTINMADFVWEYVPADKIPDAVQSAFIASEDKIFLKHHGVNARGVIEDVYARLTQQESTTGMRYTITQQLIKNQLADEVAGTSFWERVKNIVEEQYTAVMLEEDLSKEQILELYLNTISLGKNIVGVQAASRRYFGKDVSDLNVSEAAVLVAAAKDPTGMNPLEHSDENGRARMKVLKDMLDDQCISEDEYGDALGDDVYLRIQNHDAEREEEGDKVNSYYADAVLDQVTKDLREKLGCSATEAYKMVYGKGLKIYTCQDSTIQKICDDIIKKEKYYPKAEVKGKKTDSVPIQASFVLLEQETGAVRAIVGGREEKKANHSFNRAIELERQPGTIFDVLSVYTPALDTSGMTLGEVQDDTEYQYPDTNTPVSDLDNEEHLGLITLRDAIVLSKAVPTIKTLSRISVQVGYSYLQKFGLTTLVEKKRGSGSSSSMNQGDNNNDLQLKMGLGQLADGVTNLEMTSAYAAFANGGAYQTPKFYSRVEDSQGNLLLEEKEDRKQIMKKSTAWLLTDVMSSTPLQLEKNLANRSDGIAVSGKSGRTENNTDVWYMGYTPYYTFGIWAGNEEGASLDSTVYVTTMWKDIMERVHKYKNVKKASFKKPKDIISCDICTKCGNLAVQGLCNEAEGGSTIQKEFYEKGTEPEKNCTCHVKYTFCKASHKLAAEHCPEEECYEKVLLLKKETAETKDSPFLLTKYTDGTLCTIHP